MPRAVFKVRVPPTTADLIEALRRPGESYEALAARLPISLSTVNRWKKKAPEDWDGLLEMLEMAGWLRLPDLPSGSKQRPPVDQAERLARVHREIGELIALAQEEGEEDE